ncbi:MAG TPA: HAMP domain-containing sensor histidine kinase [Thermoleophilaceae bacterium]|nr:HAMP domain-containing sensor histidine kinase [Thermoleophilaceae bacterium]
MTLRARIAAVAALAVALAVVATAVFTYVAVRSSLRGEIDDSLTSRAAALSGGGGGGGAPGPPPPAREGGAAPPPPVRNGPPGVLRLRGREFQRRLAPRAEPFGGQGAYAQFISSDGDVLRPPGGGQDLPVSAKARALARDGGDPTLTDATVDGTHVRVLTSPQPGGGAVQVARSLDEVDSQLNRILVALIVVGAVGVGLGGALGAVVARTALVPIGRFTARTERLRQDADLTERMDVVGDDELARLARSYNATLDALESSAEAQRHLVADASHELRTPIASLRANIQMLSDADRLPPAEREQMQADIVGELDELTSLVGDVVELARGSKPASRLDDVRLDEVVAAVVEREARRAPGIGVEAPALPPTVVRGEPDRIARAVTNLVGNAVKWSPEGGTVEVSLADDGVLSVRDHGPGFEEADLPHVFERFYRAAAARSTPGSGLGLAIVAQAAEAHGGFAEAANADGGGALLRVGFGEPLPTP